MSDVFTRLIAGDAIEVLRQLPDRSVQCVVTSPPYFGLRDYGVAGQIGLESTLAEYVATMVAVFREVKRVLRDDGVLWLNLGDSYAANRPYQVRDSKHTDVGNTMGMSVPAGLKPKDLMGMPWRVAFALQDDGWYLRSDCIWAKPNPMPESVRDRPTKSHEYVFLLSKSPRYFWDAEAVKEEASANSHGGSEPNQHKRWAIGLASEKTTLGTSLPSSRNIRTVWTIPTAPFAEAHFATFPPALAERCIKAGTSERGACAACGAPWVRVVEPSPEYAKRLATANERGDWYARVGTNDKREDGTKHGKLEGGIRPDYRTTGWRPSCACNADGLLPDDLEVINTPTGERVGDDPSLVTGRAGMNRPRGANEGSRPITRYEQRRYAEQLRLSPHRTEMEGHAGAAFAHYIRTDRSGARPVPQDLLDDWIARGWIERVQIPERTPCETVPCVVLDPFIGAGTTALVASSLGRNTIGIDINPEYLCMTKKRIYKHGVLHRITIEGGVRCNRVSLTGVSSP